MGFLKKLMNIEFLVYLVVGALAAVLYFGLFALTVEIFDIDYRVGISVAYLLAVSFHFLANRKFTFHNSDDHVIHQWFRYLGILVINYLITLGVVSFFVSRLGFSSYFSIALSIVITVSVGFFASRFWIFHNKETSDD